MNTEHTHIYTAEDIKKYLEGKLNAAQMHAMEKAALDDLFLAEAIEGYQENKNTNWEIHLQNAKQALAQKQDGGKVIPLSTHSNKKIIWRVAAAVFVIAGLGVAYNLINNKPLPQPTEVAVNTAQTSATVEQPVATNTIPNATTATTENKEETKSKTIATTFDDKNKTTTTIDEDGNRDDLAKKDVTPGRQSAEPISSPAAPVVMDKAAEAKEMVATNEAATVAKSKAFNKPANTSNYNFNSQVFSPDNSPLPFANISIEKESFGTYADVKGNFRLNSTDSFVTVLVKSVGYQPRYYTLNSKTALNKIVLQEAAIDPKTEVVVASSKAKGTPSRKATFLKDTIINVEPADGWANYGTYISNNIDLPDDIGKDFTKGKRELEVSFNVTATGAITNIKVDKSQCNGCDEEAVKRAIQQGPQWKPKNGKAGSAKIKVQF
jgi:cytoskeletal protein RodZ